MSDTRIIVVESDLHAGSYYSPCPEGMRCIDGTEIKITPASQWVNEARRECWEDALRYIGSDSWAYLNIGDVVEGVHHGGKEIYSQDSADHSNIALALIEPWVEKAAAKIIIEGTECHTRNSEQSIAKTLKAAPNPNTDRNAWDRLEMDWCGHFLVAQHHISATSREWLRINGLGMQFAQEHAAAARHGGPLASILISGHRHTHDVAMPQSRYLVATAYCWKLPSDRHCRKVVPSSRGEVGLFILDMRDREDGKLPRLETFSRQPAAGKRFTLEPTNAGVLPGGADQAHGRSGGSNRGTGNRQSGKQRRV